MLNVSYLARLLSPLLILAALLLPTLSQAQEITVQHAQGETVLNGVPKKVFTFDLAALDTLDALGVEVAGVPSALIPDYLEKYRGDAYAKIGSLFEPDFEAVNAAAPDLIIVAGRSAPQYAALSRIAPTIDLTVAPDAFFAGAKKNTETLARIFGKEDKAAELIAQLDSSVAELRAHADSAGKALIILTNGGKISAYGTGSRFGWVHQDLGIQPAVDDVEAATHGEAVSFEFILKTNPDWLIVVDRDSAVGNSGQTARQTLDNELIAATEAAKNDRIFYADTVRWYLVGGGISSLQTVVDNLAKALGGQG
ncbi:siderophore ABC transporter substrate-binding protein [Nitratireductor pacificus]|uniref:Iron-siderophore ABC transporter, periplasmic binding component n=1 Tax=Nitratireductor pacificus pht-3B TaxID=391937 RepID=K2N2J7_9HYPH|nr:siderophore ABC transporter substrate-binding protein [Nitratireductor pacificus]EKF18468.1 iron-siderophore ABC transporter, periplasmic binding component [Nitratireductor pacificus pht-3B]